jgi:CubicO group peptidase (beta-lactamase class C family)
MSCSNGHPSRLQLVNNAVAVGRLQARWFIVGPMNRISQFQPRAGRPGPVLAIAFTAALVLAACGSEASSSSDATTVAASPTSEPQNTDPAPTEPTSPRVTEPDVDLAALVQPIIDASLAPGALDWNCCGVDVRPTSVRLGVRVAGYDDVLLSSGTRLDGSPALATDPIPGNSLGQSLVKQATLALIADGTIDPDATIAQWLPDQPNADRITVQMLLDNTHGWTTSAADLITPNLLADLTRTWTLAETLGLASSQPPIAEPGTFDSTGDGNTIGMIALAGVLEEVTGSPLADIVHDHVTEPLGLSDTFFSVGSDDPADLQFGLFVLPGGTEATDPRDLSTVAFRTIDPPANAAITTVPDLLDLLSTWSTGEYPGGIRATSANFPTLEGQTDAYQGHGIPFNGYCPCEPTADGNSPAVTGRQPNGVGNNLFVYNYPDQISVVLQYNSDEITSKADIRKIADEIHDTVAAAATN